MYYIGIDVGGTGIQMGLVNEEGQIVYRGAIKTKVEDGFNKQVKDMAECALAMCADNGVSLDEVKAIGAGVPGITDPHTGAVIFCTNLGWYQVPFATEFQKYINKPVYVDNDATVAGLAEYVAGAAVGTSSCVTLTLGTGVGSGVVVNGKVWSGAHGAGSEFGHTILVADGVPCTCGNKGCVERYCSATAIIRMGREACAEHPESAIMTAAGSLENINAKHIIDAAKAGDPVGVKVFGDYVHYLGLAISGIMNMWDPDIIVLGGGVANAGDFLLDAVRAEAKKYVLYKDVEYAPIVRAKLGTEAGIIGAAMLGLNA